MASRRILLGVGGGIAAYKAVELLRLLAESGHDVVVVPTESALRFVGAATWAALSHHPVTTDVWSGCRGRAPRAPRPGGGPGRRRAGNRRPAGPNRPRSRRRSADEHAAHRPLPGAARTSHAHRDVGTSRHRRQRRPATPARADRARSGHRPADRRRQRSWAAPGAGRDRRAGRPAADSPGRPADRSRRPACGRQRRRHPGSRRPGALLGQRVVRAPRARPRDGCRAREAPP